MYTDFSKAFDKIRHLTLITKIRNFDVHGNLFNFLVLYLINRCQYVAMNVSKSETFPVIFSLPQGSQLGALRFDICLNDISIYFKNTYIVLYADVVRYTNYEDF